MNQLLNRSSQFGMVYNHFSSHLVCDMHNNQVEMSYNLLTTYFVLKCILDAYCMNKTYNITSNSLIITIPSGTTACFSCHLPGGATVDRWTYDSTIINESSYLNGYLLLANSSAIIIHHIMDSILSCSNSVKKLSIEVYVIIKGNF